MLFFDLYILENISQRSEKVDRSMDIILHEPFETTEKLRQKLSLKFSVAKRKCLSSASNYQQKV